jgi:Acyl-CoA dehydrogenase, N-terminal domain
MSIETPSEYGGSEASFTTAIIAIEELAKVDPSVSVMADVHVYPRDLKRSNFPEHSGKYNGPTIWLSATQREVFATIVPRKTRLVLSI